MESRQLRLILSRVCLVAICALGCTNASAQVAEHDLGEFDAAGDVGSVRIPGAVKHDPANGHYTVTGSGENMWFAADAFHFVWKKLSGDFRIAADIVFVGEGKNAHRKAVLMLRQNLEADSPYVDIALHGDGLTSMQFRGDKGANTQELQFGRPAPRHAELIRQGNLIFVRLEDGQEMRLGDRPIRMENFLRGEVYVGLGVCSHDAGVAETAVFSNVILENTPPAASAP